MIKTTKVGVFKPKVYTVAAHEEVEPVDVHEAIKHHAWQQAIKEELDAFLKNVYVDDIIVASTNKAEISAPVTQLNFVFSLKDLDASPTPTPTPMHLLKELQIDCVGLPIVWCDNSTAISLTANSIHHVQVKHVEIDVHFVRERVLAGQLVVNYVPFSEQIVDILTKPLTQPMFV
ncbi:retrovirus-related pol polyprotein from transposon tnt 1-94 [Gossypium australe]|uniref:Retrovirus-related pol polyprotein from transposon tnt 1-94 n=1 Tax=Gossypium australe TaxID=47621 RepID=A0A5B6WV21_9ROSI|nr:retrovirus-related pol polyprotein from transposon tnt 1-94 [Gossypium australe]